MRVLPGRRAVRGAPLPSRGTDRTEKRRGFNSVSSPRDGIAVVEQRRADAVSAMPSCMRIVRSVSPYHVAVEGEAPNCAAIPAPRRALLFLDEADRPELGAPVTVTAQAWERKPSSASNSGRNIPSTWSTV